MKIGKIKPFVSYPGYGGPKKVANIRRGFKIRRILNKLGTL